MKIANETIERILNAGAIFGTDPADVQRLLKDLAADLKEARQSKRQVVRYPVPVIAAAVAHVTRVETPEQLRMNVPEPYATMVEGRARWAARHVEGAEPFPMYLVPRTGLWILQLHDSRIPTGQPDTAICRASTMEELSDLLARERAPVVGDLHSKTPYKVGGPLEHFEAPASTDCFVNVLESTDTYIAHAIAGLKEAVDL